MAVYLAPDPFNGTQFLPGGNSPASGAKLFTYQAGSSTKSNTYTTNLGNVAWSNPIVLDSGGNLGGSGEIWLTAGQAYKFVLAPSNDTDPPASPYWSRDNISGINDITTNALGEWTLFSGAPTFIGTSSFTISGDWTSIFTVNRRIKATVTAGTVYGTILVSSFGGAVTTITAAMDSIPLDSGMSAVYYGTISTVDTSAPSFPISQTSKSADYVLVASDENKHILHPASDTTTRTFTIPANSTIPWPIGTCLTFVNQTTTVVLNIFADSMVLAGSGATSTRTLAANGIATALKINTTSWIISGTGIS